MNAIDSPHIYMRSLATRQAQQEVPAMLADIVAVTKLSGVDLLIVETVITSYSIHYTKLYEEGRPVRGNVRGRSVHVAHIHRRIRKHCA